jgi:AraC family L-rhamnose operon regulatory protein RhaS
LLKHPKTKSNGGKLGPRELVVRPKQVSLPEFGVAVFESHHGFGFRGELFHNFSKFLLVIAGHATWEAKGETIKVGPDSLVHVPAGLHHTQQDSANDPVILYGIVYRSSLLPEFLNQELLERTLLHWNLQACSPLLARSIRSDLQEMLFEHDGRGKGWQWILCSRLVELAIRVIRIRHQNRGVPQRLFIRGRKPAERVARYVTWLQSHFYENQSLDQGASQTGLSRRQFTGMFRKETGKSLNPYLRGLRLEHSRKLLLQTDKPVTSVAFESGFEDLSCFSHAFKAAFGCPPQVLRQQHEDPIKR